MVRGYDRIVSTHARMGRIRHSFHPEGFPPALPTASELAEDNREDDEENHDRDCDSRDHGDGSRSVARAVEWVVVGIVLSRNDVHDEVRRENACVSAILSFVSCHHHRYALSLCLGEKISLRNPGRKS
jgi:hypothetical protein